MTRPHPRRPPPSDLPHAAGGPDRSQARPCAAGPPTSTTWQFNRELIQRGVQAVLTCNGLFTSNRTLDQVYEQELAYVRNPIGTAEGGDYEVDWDRKAVAIGAPGHVPTVRAAFRTGIGCVVMAPDQTVRRYRVTAESGPSVPQREPGHHPRGRMATCSRTRNRSPASIGGRWRPPRTGRSIVSHLSRSR